ncbi:cytochrome P450 [Rozella allomycis CSF55]|uniref:Cytochrome P450 n=1 Tax=Rozella allomycis (strain CSF55) TaxID=988480 RepID=A0A075B1C3_ROZAC|nr:Cytochrome P450, E-class, group I domain-containing protein [Rozella allomycis CSF55]RKP17199.1 cytochrome P450 [Rozella allomycis CSF55]|eukprot:EPZ36148.1 Cytochrome P450, E-class, group I domain-containing protein [Rozella allomycis CSF55]
MAVIILTAIAASAIYAFIFFRFFYKRRLPAEIPGPKGLPFFGVAFEINPENFSQKLESWAWGYGPMYKIKLFGQETLIISDMEVVQYILKNRPQKYTRGDKVPQVFEGLHTMGVFSNEGSEWKDARQLVTPSFAPNRLASMNNIFAKHICALKHEFSDFTKNANEIVDQFLIKKADFNEKRLHDPCPLFQNAALKIIIESAFAYGQEDLLPPSLLNEMGLVFKVTGDRLFGGFPLWMFYKTKEDRKVEKIIKRIYSIIDVVIKSYVEKKGDKNVLNRTLMESLLQTQREANFDSKVPKMTIEQMKGNIMQVMIAGYETTSSTLMWILYFLIKYPEVQRKIQEEADLVLGDRSSLTEEKISDLKQEEFPYITNVIKETMRLKSVAPFFQASNIEDEVLHGHHIPAGTDIALLTRVASLRACPTENAFEFNPERWNIDDEDIHKKQMNSFMGFGGGTRICPGRHLAMLELTLMIAVVISDYDIKPFPLPPSYPPTTELTHFTTIAKDFYVLPKRRE